MNQRAKTLALLGITLTSSLGYAGDGFAAVEAIQPPAPFTLFPIPGYGGDLNSRAALTGDWGGARMNLAEESGLQFEADLYNYYQGVVGGGSNNGWEYSGIADYIVKFDTGQAGLWQGGYLNVRGQSYFGRGTAMNTSCIVPPNAQFALRLPADVGTYLPHLYFTQFIHPKAAIAFGKLDGSIGDSNAFAHIVGNNRFMNLGLNFNPVLLKTSPYAPLGAAIMFFPSRNLALNQAKRGRSTSRAPIP